MIEKIRSLVWLDYCMAILTDFKRLGLLLSRHTFIPATLVFPVLAAFTDIIALYRAFETGRSFFVSLSYGFLLLALINIISAWLGASLLTTAVESSAESPSLSRNFSIVNITFAFRLFVLPLVTIMASISFAPAAFLFLGYIGAGVAGILCSAYCISTIYSLPHGKSIMLVIVPHLVFATAQFLLFVLGILYLVRLASLA
ncbi:MAG: hypothetical protein ACOC2H_10005 [Spirochaetota bacterium]